MTRDSQISSWFSSDFQEWQSQMQSCILRQLSRKLSSKLTKMGLKQLPQQLSPWPTRWWFGCLRSFATNHFCTSSKTTWPISFCLPEGLLIQPRIESPNTLQLKFLIVLLYLKKHKLINWSMFFWDFWNILFSLLYVVLQNICLAAKFCFLCICPQTKGLKFLEKLDQSYSKQICHFETAVQFVSRFFVNVFWMITWLGTICHHLDKTV